MPVTQTTREQMLDVVPSSKSWMDEHGDEMPADATFDDYYKSYFDWRMARPLPGKGQPKTKDTKTMSVANELAPTTNPNVVSASERYSDERPLAKNAITGEHIMHKGELLRLPSQRMLARVGAWYKSVCNHHADVLQESGYDVPRINEEDKQLLGDLYAKGRWTGTKADGTFGENLTREQMGLPTKTIINDATSGGDTTVPVDLDSIAVITPLVNGELYPFITRRSTNRDSVRTHSVTTPSVIWGTAEGSQISLLDTDDFFAEIDADVEKMSIACTWGIDLESDSALDIGGTVAEVLGDRVREQLDYVICLGNGTTQPEGFLTASGTTSVSCAGGAGAAPSVTDTENLAKAINKALRTPDSVYVMNDTSYWRYRGVAIGATDTRRVFGMATSGHSSYRLIDFPVRINNSITNPVHAFIALKRYVVWERSGMEIVIESGGKELRRKSERMLVLRKRLAGKLLIPSACAKITDGQA